jgi:hypothetical protein
MLFEKTQKQLDIGVLDVGDPAPKTNIREDCVLPHGYPGGK